MPRCPQQWLLCHVPHIYLFSHLLSPGITCPIKPPARGSLSQALLSAKAPTGLSRGPARGELMIFSPPTPRSPGRQGSALIYCLLDSGAATFPQGTKPLLFIQ